MFLLILRLTLAAFGPLHRTLNQISLYAPSMFAFSTHRTCDRAQWNTTIGTSFVSSTSASTFDRKMFDGELCDPLIFPPG